MTEQHNEPRSIAILLDCALFKERTRKSLRFGALGIIKLYGGPARTGRHLWIWGTALSSPVIVYVIKCPQQRDRTPLLRQRFWTLNQYQSRYMTKTTKDRRKTASRLHKIHT